MKYFAGLDVSLDETAICVVDEDGIVITEGKATSEPEDLVRWLVATGLRITRVGLEAGPLSPWLHTELLGRKHHGDLVLRLLAVAGCPPQTRNCVDFDLVSGVAQQIVSKEPTAAAAKWVPPSDEPYTGPMVGVAKTVIRAPTIGYRWALE
jgi:hypothetical protein